MTSFQSSASDLGTDTLFDDTTVTVSGSSKVKVSSGSSAKSFTLETTQLAKKDITQLGSIASKSTEVGDDDGTLEIKIGKDSAKPDKTIDIKYTKDMTLQELAQAITEEAASDISVSILKTADDEFSLILTSAKTGEDQKLTITDKDGNLDGALFDDKNNYKNVQAAQDSKFKYNDIEMTRSTNEISDVVLGLDITLTKKDDFSRVEIKDDNSSIIEKVELFIKNYNTLKANLSDMIAYDKDKKTVGVFQGDAFVQGVSRDVTGYVTQRLNGDSLVNYGISLKRDGTMAFDKSILEKKLKTDRTSVKEFFTGSTDKDGNTKDGIFQSINDKMKSSYIGYNKLLSNFETNLKTRGKNLAKDMLKAQTALDNQFDILTKRFTAYDSVISQFNNTFSSLKQQIAMATNAK
jgi:flagellar hook-associated protein 2